MSIEESIAKRRQKQLDQIEFKDELKVKYSQFFGDAWKKFGDYLEIGEGWRGLLNSLLEDLTFQIAENFPETTLTFLQIKEKFGTLRVYTQIDGPGAEELEAIIREAENRSSKICHVCGEPGALRPLSWAQTLCNKHYVDSLMR